MPRDPSECACDPGYLMSVAIQLDIFMTYHEGGIVQLRSFPDILKSNPELTRVDDFEMLPPVGQSLMRAFV